MQLVEIEVERALALHVDGLTQDVCSDEWIAVTIATDPGSHANEGWQLGVAPGRINACKPVLQIGVKARQLAEKGVVIIRKAIGDLVDDRRPAASQQARLPQDQDRARERV